MIKIKLFLCPDCDDIVKLRTEIIRTCYCGHSSGVYEKDGLHATIGGKAIPLGFKNSGLWFALQNRPTSGQGICFEAFVIPKICDTVTKGRLAGESGLVGNCLLKKEPKLARK